ncbi:hypothetical protein EVAR_36227_1 [Eumeta japonica]|uniref:Uncharacterized protein n=1 Tax=Eumeta variegata TaxID=151549 RepID=A0A4C1WZJ4_EUMVA|nr:hypothetical protein EVAR_36227_1 [Eumeta japonica]
MVNNSKVLPHMVENCARSIDGRTQSINMAMMVFLASGMMKRFSGRNEATSLVERWNERFSGGDHEPGVEAEDHLLLEFLTDVNSKRPNIGLASIFTNFPVLQYNSSAQSALKKKDFSLPYSPDLAKCDYFVPQKELTQEKRFSST